MKTTPEFRKTLRTRCRMFFEDNEHSIGHDVEKVLDDLDDALGEPDEHAVEEIKTGDIVEYVGDDGEFTKGEHYVVKKATDMKWYGGSQVLTIAGHGPGWSERDFRKVKPEE